MGSTRVVVALALFIMLAQPALSPTPAWTKPLEPLVVGWEHVFTVDWQASERDGRPIVSGYVANTSPHRVTKIRLLVDALDSNGNVVGQQVSWARGGELGPFSRIYYEAPAPRVASSTYRVRVFDFERVELKSRN